MGKGKRELSNSISHSFGVVLQLAGLEVLVVYADRLGDPYKIVSFSIYGVTLLLLYLFFRSLSQRKRQCQAHISKARPYRHLSAHRGRTALYDRCAVLCCGEEDLLRSRDLSCLCSRRQRLPLSHHFALRDVNHIFRPTGGVSFFPRLQDIVAALFS
jgi:hypothetical protein